MSQSYILIKQIYKCFTYKQIVQNRFIVNTSIKLLKNHFSILKKHLPECNSNKKLMDLSPFRQNFEKNRNGQKCHHSLKDHPTFTKIAKFGCEML